MATTFLESGTDATQDLTFYSSTLLTGTGTVSSASDQSHTGLRSLKCACGGTGGSQAQARTSLGILSDAGSRIDFWMRLDASSTAAAQIWAVSNSSSQGVFVLRLQTSNKLNINTGTGTDLSTGTIALSLNAWNRITVSFTITSTTVFTIKVFINGVLDQTATNSGTLARTGSNLINFNTNNAVNSNIWYDDIYVDNSSALTDSGDIRVTAKRPLANGTTNGYSTQIGAGGSGYGTGHAPQVNEQPLNTANGWSMVGAGSAVTEEYNIENAATGDVNLTGATIVDYMGWLFSSSLVGETAQIIVNGNTSNISLTSTNTLFMSVAGSTSYPAGTGADIGEITSTSLTTVSLYEAGILLAFNPAPAVASIQEFMLMGVGT